MVTAAPLEIYFLTFNCARTLIDTQLFASHLFRALPKNATTLPDVIAVSLQEVAPIAYSFLGGSWISPYLQRFDDAVQMAARTRAGHEHGDAELYERLLVNAVGMTVGMVYVKSEIRQRVRWIQAAGVGVGVWEMGNKGAAGIRLALDETELTFVAAHLAPMEGDVLRRNEDWKNIVRGLVFENVDSGLKAMGGADESEPLLSGDATKPPAGGTGLYKPNTTVFFGGDLNYRTSHTKPNPDTHKTFPRPSERNPGSSTNTAGRISVEQLLERDQLTQERLAGRTLHGFAELPIKFSPTYKYDPQDSGAGPGAVPKPADAEVLDDELLEDHQSWQWAKHRWPSWCDRILYISSAGLEPQGYTSLPLHASSDHRAVALSALKHHSAAAEGQGDSELLKYSPFPLNPDWKAQRAAARRRELAVGVASYLTLTMEGNLILLGLLGGGLAGYLYLRSFL